MQKSVILAMLISTACMFATPASAQFQIPDIEKLSKQAPKIDKIIENGKVNSSAIRKIIPNLKQTWDIEATDLICTDKGKASPFPIVKLDGRVSITYSDNIDNVKKDKTVWAPQFLPFQPEKVDFLCGGTGHKLAPMNFIRLELTPEQVEEFRYKVSADLTNRGNKQKVAMSTSEEFQLVDNANLTFKIPPRPNQPQLVLKYKVKRIY